MNNTPEATTPHPSGSRHQQRPLPSERSWQKRFGLSRVGVWEFSESGPRYTEFCDPTQLQNHFEQRSRPPQSEGSCQRLYIMSEQDILQNRYTSLLAQFFQIPARILCVSQRAKDECQDLVFLAGPFSALVEGNGRRHEYWYPYSTSSKAFVDPTNLFPNVKVQRLHEGISKMKNTTYMRHVDLWDRGSDCVLTLIWDIQRLT